MNKTKTLIQILVLPKDIDYLERTLLLLKQNFPYVDRETHSVILDVTLALSDYLTDWESSILKQDYFLNKFKHFEKYVDCWDSYNFNIGNDVLGLLDNFLEKINFYKDIDNLIILETDILFNPYTLHILLESAEQISKSHSEYIITPEHTKLWDPSWDIIVNSKFINLPTNYRDFGDGIFDTIYDDNQFEIVPLLHNERNHFKFGGGWFTLYCKQLLDNICFPIELKGYGPLDNFITHYCNISPNAVQYKIKNLVITEDCKYTKSSLYDNYVHSLNRKHDYYDTNVEIMYNHFKNKFGF